MARRGSVRGNLARMEMARLPGRKVEIEYETYGEPMQRYDREPRSAWHDQPRMEGRRAGQRRDRDGRYMTRGNWDDGMDPRMGYAQSNYDGPDYRFRDRRGREHYDDGRFAPMSNWGYDPESRSRDREGRELYDDGRYAPMGNGGRYGPYAEGQRPFGRESGGEMMYPIGFNANWDTQMRSGADATIPRYNEMDRMPGNRAVQGGYMGGPTTYGKMDEATAMEWVKGMDNEDGSKTPHWTMDQVRQVIKQKNITLEPAEFFAVINALYSDFDPILKKHNVSNMEFYVDMTKAWLQDKDAVPGKAMAYYECIVKR